LADRDWLLPPAQSSNLLSSQVSRKLIEARWTNPGHNKEGLHILQSL
jgi:hypothetical protein